MRPTIACTGPRSLQRRVSAWTAGLASAASVTPRARVQRPRPLGTVLVFALLVATASSAFADEADSDDLADPPADAASEPAAPAGPPELIQVYESPDIGEFKLPGLWTVTDVEDGVRAVEPHDRPAAIEIGALPLPEKLPAETLAMAIVDELTHVAAGVAPTVLENDAVAAERDERRYLALELTENSAQMRYGVLVVTTRKRALVATLAAPAERFDDMTPRSLLQDIVDSIK